MYACMYNLPFKIPLDLHVLQALSVSSGPESRHGFQAWGEKVPRLAYMGVAYIGFRVQGALRIFGVHTQAHI